MRPEDLSKQIGALTDRRRQLQAALPHAQDITAYDRLAREIERVEYDIEILMLQRDIARAQAREKP